MLLAESVSYETVGDGNMVLTEEQLQVVLQCPIFTGAEPDWLLQTLDRAAEEGRCRLRTYEREEPVRPRRVLGVLLSGRILVQRRTLDGRLMAVSTQMPGAAFGMAVLFTQAEELPTLLHCQTPCQVLFLSEELLRDMMQERFRIAENYIRYLSNRIAFLNGKIAGLSAGDSVHRLAQWLLSHARDSTVITMPPMTTLASELNLGRASLYRALDTLEQSGAIHREGRAVTVRSEPQLRGLDDTPD